MGSCYEIDKYKEYRKITIDNLSMLVETPILSCLKRHIID